MTNPDIPTSEERELFQSRTARRSKWTVTAAQLDDEDDAQELRDRYYGLLQELRVILPGAQVLVAFLLTTPFTAGFARLDEQGRFLFGVATIAGLLSVITLLTPTVFHRVANRRYRSARLVWAIRLTIVGVVLLGAALMAALYCVTRFIYSDVVSIAITVPMVATMIALWGVLPLTARPNRVQPHEGD